MILEKRKISTKNNNFRFELSVGSYIIIPATFEYGVSSNFMIRIYAEKQIDLKELK